MSTVIEPSSAPRMGLPEWVLLVTFLIPLSAMALGILVLGEALTCNALAGVALIFIGLALVDGRILRR